jgi:YfiH family protein
MSALDPPWPAEWIVPDWPRPPHVRAVFTTRSGGASAAPYGAAPERGGGMNLGLGSGDATVTVRANRARLAQQLPAAPRWLQQVHGAVVVDADTVDADAPPVVADASVALASEAVCAVLVADCLPVLLTDHSGRAVAAAHAGWRGLAGGVLQATVARLRQRVADPGARVMAWIGPGIGPQHFEVGDDVLQAMQQALPTAARAFVRHGERKWLADLPQLAKMALAEVDVQQVAGGTDCTASDPQRFYSHRRDRGVTGRHAALIWRAG